VYIFYCFQSLTLYAIVALPHDAQMSEVLG